MRKFVHFEDNGDETITVTVRLDDEGEHVFVMSMNFDDIVDSISTSSMEEAQEIMNEHAVYIPNKMPE
jgi:hypothetical protein